MKGITLLSLVNLALKHIAVLIVSALVFSTAAFAYCKYVAVPQYSAKGSVIVTNGALLSDNDSNSKNSLDNTDVVASINFADTVNDTLNTNGIFKQLSEKLDRKYSYQSLLNMAEISRRSTSSLFIDVTFTTNSKTESVLLVNKYLELAPDYINGFFPNTAAVSVSVADEAQKISPKPIIAIPLSGICGAFIAYLIISLIIFNNHTITAEEDFKERFNLPVIGTVPDFTSAKSNKAYKYNKYYNYTGQDV